MTMTTFHLPSGSLPHKLSQSRSKGVKPILKKLSHSEKNSLDLDRGWEEQKRSEWGEGIYEATTARDAPPPFAAGDVEGGVESAAAMHRYHLRSTSQTSSTASGPRSGFVHPFQQTPGTSTPPIAYTRSSASFDGIRNCSPTIAEAEDDDEQGGRAQSYRKPRPHSHYVSPSAVSQPNITRPSLAGHRTSSFSESKTTVPPQLRLNTSRTAPVVPSRRVQHGASSLATSQPDLQLSPDGGLDSPAATFTSSPSYPPPPPPPQLASANSSASTSSPMSPLRASLDSVGFPRLRSRSDLDTAMRADKLRAARRKFDERERAKEEKYDREMVRKRERQDAKAASRSEKRESTRKNSGNSRNSASSSSATNAYQQHQQPTSSATDLPRPCTSRKSSTQTSSVRSTSATATVVATTSNNNNNNNSNSNQFPSTSSSRIDLSSGSLFGGTHGESSSAGEKPIDFVSRGYDSVPGQTPPAFGPGVDDVRFQSARRRQTSTKRKTQGYWHGFILWLRMKLLRLTGR